MHHPYDCFSYAMQIKILLELCCMHLKMFVSSRHLSQKNVLKDDAAQSVSAGLMFRIWS